MQVDRAAFRRELFHQLFYIFMTDQPKFQKVTFALQKYDAQRRVPLQRWEDDGGSVAS